MTTMDYTSKNEDVELTVQLNWGGHSLGMDA